MSRLTDHPVVVVTGFLAGIATILSFLGPLALFPTPQTEISSVLLTGNEGTAVREPQGTSSPVAPHAKVRSTHRQLLEAGEDARAGERQREQSTADKQQDPLLRYLQGAQPNTPGVVNVIVVAVDEAQQPDQWVSGILATALEAQSAKALCSVLTAEFISDGLFARVFAGTQPGILASLQLTNRADIVLLARKSVLYSTNQTLDGLISARLQFEISALSAADSRRFQPFAKIVSGVGFLPEDAQALAEERLRKELDSIEFERYLDTILSNSPDTIHRAHSY